MIRIFYFSNYFSFVKIISCVVVLFFAQGCAPFFVPNPPASSAEEQTEGIRKAVEAAPERKVRTNEIDFGRAFEEAEVEAVNNTASLPRQYISFTVRKRPVRVLVKRNVKDAVVYSAAQVKVRTAGGVASFKGRMHVEASSETAAVAVVSGNSKRKLSLPCTLSVNSAGHLLELGGDSYRGELIIVSENGKTLSFVNVIDIEEYLRGVVPLEIGALKEQEIEAVKAQAVAARTYTYRKMAASGTNFFDLVSTVADQVYGGANAEKEACDMAIRRTKDLIMTFNNTVAGAFYHSTCGGKTANIEDVWGGESLAYLRSVSDTDPDGNAYCGFSRAFTWEESWSNTQLGKIFARFSPEGGVSPSFNGTLHSLRIRERFSCGRVKACAIESSGGTFIIGGDRVRFLIRSNSASNPILRSSNFTIETANNDKVVIKGRGYGHGIGMCQTGAIGRARAGQSFEQILFAYYSGVTIASVASK
ncbi:MAG: SpoIID/LytB domain-containing protein [Chitinispirillales bacterium]|nr:SpoIID/LytB domain-containing protein [Chitinispirillales bacterium]